MLLTQPHVLESKWPLLLVSLVVVGLFALFHAVVSGATQAGELRRQAAAARAAAVLRCNALPRVDLGKTCIKDLALKENPDAGIAFAGAFDSANAYPAVQ